MTDPDVIVDLADRMRAKQRRGEDTDFEFEIDFYSLTAAEQDAFVALLNERIAHGEERAEALDETNRILRALVDVLTSSAPPGMTLGEALQGGYIGVLDVVEAIRGGVLDPLAEQEPDS